MSAVVEILRAWLTGLLDRPVPSKETALLMLANLREEGVQVRNAGSMPFETNEAFIEWERAVVKWDQDVIAALRKVSEGRAEWFRVLDVVPPARVECLASCAIHREVFKQHDFRLARLYETINSLWGFDQRSDEKPLAIVSGPK